MTRIVIRTAGVVLAGGLLLLGCGDGAFTAAPAADAGAAGDATGGRAAAGAGGSQGVQLQGGSAHGGSAHAGATAAGGSELGGAGAGGTSGTGAAGGLTAQGGSGGSTETAGTGGGVTTGGNSGASGSSGVSGGGETGGGSGSGGASGSGGVSDSGGVSGSAGSTAQAGAAGSCSQPVAWFPDNDGDHIGRSSGKVIACDPPTNGAWVLVEGDCDDDNALVFPKASDYRGDSYVPAAGGKSYDYDCSTMEESDPSQYGAAAACNALACGGSGFVATGRSGAGVNALCGSTSLSTCTKKGLACNAIVTQVSAHRCH